MPPRAPDGSAWVGAADPLAKPLIPPRAGNSGGSSATCAGGAVHPRASGERFLPVSAWPWDHGSSPRERGTRVDVLLLPRYLRFIPARAGNVDRPPPVPGGASVHPRASGERAAAIVQPRARRGSSPRERGTPRPWCARLAMIRFIPARAGNAWPAPWLPTRSCGSSPRERGTPWLDVLTGRQVAVHPRASGERIHEGPLNPILAGSSPRERGTPGERLRDQRLLRFIPARAGNARRPATRRWIRSVHPRASGERARRFAERSKNCGSSPRRAGNACAPRRASRRSAVHPRASGERVSPVTCSRSTVGSSPRERGTHRSAVVDLTRSRFIPARAGNASHGRIDWRGRPGSSPRERGTHRGRRDEGRRGRFIPARAGNARCRNRRRNIVAVHPRASGNAQN